MNKLLIGVCLAISASACTKKTSTDSYSVFRNTTAHSIAVTAYQSGKELTIATFNMSPSGEYKEGPIYSEGAARPVSFGKFYLIFADSIRVTFDNTYSISHYNGTISGISLKQYPFSSVRNIFNELSYTSVLTKDERYRKEWTSTYTFTEQDYLDAKQ